MDVPFMDVESSEDQALALMKEDLQYQITFKIIIMLLGCG